MTKIAPSINPLEFEPATTAVASESSIVSQLRVLSIQSSNMGHRSYALEMRRRFEESAQFNLDAHWLDDDREWISRVAVRAFTLRMPVSWGRAANLDLWRSRAEAGYGWLGRRLALRHLSRSAEPCLLHFHTQVPALLSVDLMRRHPTVLTGDMTAPQVSREYAAAPTWTMRPGRWLEERTFAAAAHIAMWSEWARRSVVDECGAEERKTSVVYPGVDLTQFPERPLLPASPRPVRLLFVGSDFKRKGGDDLLEVFLDGFTDRAELHLVTGVAPTCHHPAVQWYPGVEPYSAEWVELFRQADVFVLPTRQEAFGLAFIEAMAAGLPVIATRINAVPELIEHDRSGLLIRPDVKSELAGALHTMIGNEQLRLTFGREGRRIAEAKFDSRKNFGRLEAIFDGLATTHCLRERVRR